MMATSGIYAGRVVRVLSNGAHDALVTTDIHCDESRSILPGDVTWQRVSELRPLTEMELIGAMAL